MRRCGPGAIDAMAGYLDAHPDVAVAAPTLVHADGSSAGLAVADADAARATCSPRCGSGAGARRCSTGAARSRSGWAMGCALLARRDAVRAAGGFDEGYFMYSEEVDLLVRLGATHWVPEAEVVHEGQASDRRLAGARDRDGALAAALPGASTTRAAGARRRGRRSACSSRCSRSRRGCAGGRARPFWLQAVGAWREPGGAGPARARRGVQRGAPMSVADQPEDVLDSGEAGGRAIRGGALFTGTYVLGLLLSIASVPFMIRHLGVVDYGYYVSVSAVVFIIGGFTEAGLTNLGIREYSQLRPGEREPFLRNLVGLRLSLTTVGVVDRRPALTALAGSPAIVVGGVAIVGLGLLVQLTQQTYTVPLNVQLRMGWISILGVIRQATLSGLFILLVVLNAGLTAFFWANVVDGRRARRR